MSPDTVTVEIEAITRFEGFARVDRRAGGALVPMCMLYCGIVGG